MNAVGRVRRLYIDGGCGQLHVREACTQSDTARPPLYCLHQSPKSGLEFERFMAAAVSDRTVVAPDYPGYGNSDAPPSEADATIELYAKSMWQVADALGHQTLDLFGNHTGGKVAVEMALRQPDRVRAIAMISAAILTDDERAQFRDMFTPIPLDEAGTRFTQMWQRIKDHRGAGMTLEMMAESLSMNLMGGEAYEWGHKAAFDHGKPFEAAIAKLPHRITILNPADMLQETTRRASALMHNGEVIECPDWGQGCMDAYPANVADLVLSRLDASKRASR